MGATLIQNRLQTLFGQREHNRDRLKLSDDNDATGVSRVYDIANVDEANSDAPINRRLDLGVIELRLGVVDRRLIRLYGCLKLIDCEPRGIKSLLIEDFPCQQIGVAFLHDLRVPQLRFVLRFLGHGLVHRCLIWPGIDDR